MTNQSCTRTKWVVADPYLFTALYNYTDNIMYIWHIFGMMVYKQQLFSYVLSLHTQKIYLTIYVTNSIFKISVLHLHTLQACTLNHMATTIL